MEVIWPLVLYLGLKYLAYALWCGLLAGFRPGEGWRGAWGLGLARLLVGAAIGGSLTAAGIHLQWAQGAIPAFLALLLPIRWLEWSIVAHLGLRQRPSVPSLVLGLDGRTRLWQAGGIVVSFATDILLVIAGGMMRALVC